METPSFITEAQISTYGDGFCQNSALNDLFIRHVYQSSVNSLTNLVDVSADDVYKQTHLFGMGFGVNAMLLQEQVWLNSFRDLAPPFPQIC